MAAAAWGWAEATWFFVVPDVLTSAIALRRPRAGLVATLGALAGALAGGLATYAWGSRLPATASRAWLVRVPAIDDPMVTRVEAEMADQGPRALLVGPLRGVPYKIYARTAGLHRLPLGPFLAWSALGRMPRFVLVTGVVGALARAAGRTRGRSRWARLLRDRRTHAVAFATGWTAFYAWFWTRGT